MTTLNDAALAALAAPRGEEARLAMLVQDRQQIAGELDQARADRDKIETRISDLTSLLANKATAIQVQEGVLANARGLAERVAELGIDVHQPAPQTPAGGATPPGGVPALPASVFDEVLREHPEMQQTQPFQPVDANTTTPDAPAQTDRAVAKGGRRG